MLAPIPRSAPTAVPRPSPGEVGPTAVVVVAVAVVAAAVVVVVVVAAVAVVVLVAVVAEEEVLVAAAVPDLLARAANAPLAESSFSPNLHPANSI